jgi:transcriptional regulator with XRE-family HTH domain
MRQYSLKQRGKELRKIRRLWGIDLDYVARQAGLTKSTLSKFERGRNDLRVDTYARLLDAVEQIGEIRAEVLDYVIRVKTAREEAREKAKKTGGVPLSNLFATQFENYGEEELREWIANETKNQLELNKVRSFSDKIKQGYEMEIELLQGRIAELRDLLQLETEAAVKASEADSLREKIKARDSGETEE